MGCSDETLLLKLRIDEKEPPEYCTLLASIQLEEAKHTHRTLTKKMAKSHQVQAEEQIQQLKQEVGNLKQQSSEPLKRRNLGQKVEEL